MMNEREVLTEEQEQQFQKVCTQVKNECENMYDHQHSYPQEQESFFTNIFLTFAVA